MADYSGTDGLSQYLGDSTGEMTQEENKALDFLQDILADTGGSVSTRLFRKRLEQCGMENARDLAVSLKLRAKAAEANEDDFPIRHMGRSFYTQETYRDVEAKTESEAEQAEAKEETIPVEEKHEESPEKRRRYRQEEARLGQYLTPVLENLYGTEYGPDCEYVFDVHSARAGNDFENVDLLAVHWRSDVSVEIVTVEVKLDFTAQLVQQANNYTRFSDRVWIAIPVSFSLEEAALELRANNERLFEYCVSLGLGILGCRMRQGRSYEIGPLHWPRLQTPDKFEREAFFERHRDKLEKACVLAPAEDISYPKF